MYDLDILAITETWLHQDTHEVVLKLICPPGYAYLSQPRTYSRAGGVALICRAEFSPSRFENQHPYCVCSENIECMTAVLTLRSHKLPMCVIYRPPSGSVHQFLDCMDNLFSATLHAYETPCIFLGDVNIHLDIRDSPSTTSFLSLLNRSNYKQLVHMPTHEGGRILDAIITHESATPNVSDVHITCEVTSDHFVVKLLYHVHRLSRVTNTKVIHYRPWKTVDQRGIVRTILTNFWASESSDRSGDVNTFVEDFQTVSKQVVDFHVPERTKTIREDPNFLPYNTDLQNMKKRRRCLERRWRAAKLTDSPSTTTYFAEYREYCKAYARALDRVYTAYCNDKVAQIGNDLGKLSSFVTKLMGDVSITTLPTHTDSHELAAEFNDFFICKVARLRDSVSGHCDPLSDGSYLGELLTDFQRVTPAVVWKVLAKSKNSSCDLDLLPSWVIKKHPDAVVSFLCSLANLSLSSGVFPSRFKEALVKPLLKKSNLDGNQMANYRPVSNLGFLSKFLERCVLRQLTDHMSRNECNDPYQSAYRAQHGIETTILSVAELINASLDNGDAILLVALDLSAAFDTLSHDILLRRLRRSAGVSGRALEWFDSYLRGRTQAVVIGKHSSSPRSLQCGVPQGSVLGGPLFAIYMAPLGDVLSRRQITYRSYADDTQILHAFKIQQPDIRELQDCLAVVQAWMRSSSLVLNDDKTEIKVFSRATLTAPLNFAIFDRPPETTSTRSLGFILDSAMSFRDQIDAVCKSANFHLYRIRAIRNRIDTATARTMVNWLVMSRVTSFLSLYHGLPNRDTHRLQLIQNKAARLVCQVHPREHITPTLRELQWLPITALAEQRLLHIAHKAIYTGQPTYIAGLLTMYDPPRDLRSRGGSLLVQPRCRGRYGERCFSFAAPKLWNSLPEDLRTNPSFSVFKRKLFIHIFSKCYA